MFTEKVKFYLVNSETLNAFTTGGEHMYVYSGLLLQCQSEDELAAVMAHEYAHVYSRHVKKGMDRQLTQNVGTGVVAAGAGIVSFFLGGGLESGISTASSAASYAKSAGQFVGMNYTRSDEDEADLVGFDFYTRAGWDPKRFADFFRHMIDLGHDTGSEMFSDHPKLSKRVNNADKRMSALPADASEWRKPPIAAVGPFRALQRRVAKVAAAMPSDPNMQKAQTLLSAFPSCVDSTVEPGQKRAKKQVQKDAWNAQFQKPPKK